MAETKKVEAPEVEKTEEVKTEKDIGLESRKKPIIEYRDHKKIVVGWIDVRTGKKTLNKGKSTK